MKSISHEISSEMAALTSSEEPKQQFRPDIEGLRALAVVPILLNHLGVRGFSGGFIGVDIFFVISGFLITSIIWRELTVEKFSFREFYRRRVARLMPPFAAMIVACSLAALVFMTPAELVNFSKSVIAAVFFTSNLYFFSDTGYFDAGAASRPLLHTWSLAVEEQFYIIWPLILSIIYFFCRKNAVWILVSIVALSSLASFFTVYYNMPVAFYWLPFRAWELGLGGLLALHGPVRRLPGFLKETLALVSILFLVYCVIFYREPMVFPGLTAVPPCLATLALIALPATKMSEMLTLTPIRWIGRISYSLYLWHWPIVVFSKLGFFNQSVASTIVQLCLSVIMGAASYYLIESRSRAFLARISFSGMVAIFSGSVAFCLIMPFCFLATSGFSGRYTPVQNQIASVALRNEQHAYREGTCFVVDASARFDREYCMKPLGRPSVLLAGDSLAAHYWPGFEKELGEFGLMQATMIGCRPMIYPPDDTRPCATFFRQLLEGQPSAETGVLVLLSGRWTASDLPLFEKSLAEMTRNKINVAVLGTVPRYKAPLPRIMFFQAAGSASNNFMESGLQELDDNMRRISAKYAVPYFSMLDALCTGGTCLEQVGGVPLQFDGAHFTIEGSAFAANLIRRFIKLASIRNDPAVIAN